MSVVLYVGQGQDGASSQGESRQSFNATPRILTIVAQVLLLGSGDSGKSTILKQMRLIHKVPFSTQEVESYRQLVFNNLTHGLKYVLDAMEDMELKVSEENQEYIQLIEDAQDIRDGQPYPVEYLEPLRKLWDDTNVQKCWERGNEAALPDKYVLLNLITYDPGY